MALISSPGVITTQHVADCHTSSDALDVPSLLSPIRVLDQAPPSRLQASLNSSMTKSNHTYYLPEHHSPPLAPASSGPSRAQPSSAPGLGGTAEGESGTMAALHKERDALDPPSVVLENAMTAPDLPPQFPPASSVLRPSRGVDSKGSEPHKYQAKTSVVLLL
ncbi:hypothetical protein H4582DRAFT_2080910 [Lactarius indigo]|nr:hypothetical protein H4582DRAFT_2080910 [Lactarius indigo]